MFNQGYKQEDLQQFQANTFLTETEQIIKDFEYYGLQQVSVGGFTEYLYALFENLQDENCAHLCDKD